MPETRYIEEYTYPSNLSPKDRVPTNAIIKRIPYMVSDEELERERAEKTVAELSILPDAELTTAQLKQLVKALAELRR